ncbi:hypothetical protein EXU57_02700 [Segetibacter sp. 3557_3]|uniref:hypothetical protein n=1 Tax=Segetibacter sp. 3557_3 TaxID=2547429 RepID=UPI001059022C|nr:hypothetical protein [Segetibacter sp. 3557_3]TDH29000.1 hypothetical protein EXU57_02700 [Segetibacter sp. 3557_3]
MKKIFYPVSLAGIFFISCQALSPSPNAVLNVAACCTNLQPSTSTIKFFCIEGQQNNTGTSVSNNYSILPAYGWDTRMLLW